MNVHQIVASTRCSCFEPCRQRRLPATERMRAKRAGVTTLESALVLLTFLILVVGILDLGLAVYRYNLLGEAARHLVRQATIHGEEAAPEVEAWGPGEFTGTADDGSAQADAIRPMMAGIDLENVTISISWPDGDHREGDRVRVELAYTYLPVTPLLGDWSVDLRAVSTMSIVH